MPKWGNCTHLAAAASSILSSSNGGAGSDIPGNVSKSGRSAEFISRELKSGSATGALASCSTATASTKSEGALASATLGTSTAISDIGLYR
ncbi:hypothetical protein Cri9333_4721 (plasmid) [Crinalium epipsammum PCC 9333]|uniref:Uncharacterized protein n=1 Tax=Crinalium epipsammum PCC 9333 TaxID=1173022 RepID=K9W6R8_9CYAN|nr:hypothetical protein [Crinalium epipsammum]AFZ15499.1 hypothetical protein Cri9333_4721 [Crinalium epipsammum PCC 9333]